MASGSDNAAAVIAAPHRRHAGPRPGIHDLKNNWKLTPIPRTPIPRFALMGDRAHKCLGTGLVPTLSKHNFVVTPAVQARIQVPGYRQ